jgi:hypothetical protein
VSCNDKWHFEPRNGAEMFCNCRQYYILIEPVGSICFLFCQVCILDYLIQHTRGPKTQISEKKQVNMPEIELDKSEVTAHGGGILDC